MELERVPLSMLVLDPSNARKHAAKNLEAIKGSLAKFGQQKPIVVGASNVVIAGNGTLEAARLLGWDEINVIRTELTGSQATAFAIADNRTGELAEWDAGALSATLASLRDMEFDLGSIGFDADDLGNLIITPEVEGLTDPDEVPENVEPKCKVGDLYILGAHRYNGQYVYEPFTGSGSTLIACEKTSRRCFGMEIDPHYCDIILARWEAFTGKKATLETAKEVAHDRRPSP